MEANRIPEIPVVPTVDANSTVEQLTERIEEHDLSIALLAEYSWAYMDELLLLHQEADSNIIRKLPKPLPDPCWVGRDSNTKDHATVFAAAMFACDHLQAYKDFLDQCIEHLEATGIEDIPEEMENQQYCMERALIIAMALRNELRRARRVTGRAARLALEIHGLIQGQGDDDDESF